MAITNAYPRIKAEIVVNGVALEEYEDDEVAATPAAVTKYVEVTSGADFAVRVQITPAFTGRSMLFDVYVDGKNLRGLYADEKRWKGLDVDLSIGGALDVRGGAWSQQNFCFSDMKIGMLRASMHMA